MKQGNAMLLAGGILEALLAACGIGVVALYLTEASSELARTLLLGAAASVKAMFGLYGLTALHLVAALAAFFSRNRRGAVAFVAGLALLAVTNVCTNWDTVSSVQVGLNMLPGALIAGGGLLNLRAAKAETAG